jgi:hypothetical protein
VQGVVGTATIVFTSEDSAVFSYELNDGTQGELNLERFF